MTAALRTASAAAAAGGIAAARTIEAGGYAVRVGAGFGAELAVSIAQVAPAHQYAVVSDSNVAPLHAVAVRDALQSLGGGRASLHVVHAGEAFKTRESWGRLTDELLDAGCGRDTTVVAVGGGVVGDLAGFVAATYLRGVPVVQCPTSLLAMIDASVGGKTGVDTAAGKNLVGAFHAPAAVFADVALLHSLPLAHRRAGLAEAIKHGVIADERYFEQIVRDSAALLDADPALLVELVARSVELKAGIVAEDEREAGRRKTLNFGHTIGHAVEHLSGYELLHGDCVAIGMSVEARIAERLGVASQGTARRIDAALASVGLPSAMPATMSAEAVLGATRMDKKSRGGQVEYALPARIGAMAGEQSGWALAVSDDVVREVLA